MTNYNFIKNDNKNPDIETVNIIKSFLLKEAIDESDITFLNDFFNKYFSILNEYTNSQNPTLELRERLQLLTIPINDAFNYSKLGKLSPAIKIILDNIDSQGKKIEKEFESMSSSNSLSKPKVLSLTQNHKGHAITEDYTMNAFWQGPLIIAIAGIVGIVLSCILYFYR